MNTYKFNLKSLSFIMLSLLLFYCVPDSDTPQPEDEEQQEKKPLDLSISIPPGGNSWVTNDLEENSVTISDAGIHNWTNETNIIRTYFKVYTTGALNVGFNAKAPSGASTLKVSVGSQSREITIANSNYKNIEVGTFDISEAGYHYIEIECTNKTTNYVADINEILIGGAATTQEVTFVKDDFYWGRRGPSVHLSYQLPDNKNILWFYNEVTVPQGEDVIGSYFMANGFGQGYFGMQVNSETERRVLFSVWSPYDTQNPDEIPEDYKIILLGSGEGVTIGEFGNEGSGGQSYKVFDWQAGTTYKFLLKGEPAPNNSTDYTAYFYAPETGEWKLIASFRRPYTSTYLTNFHSFLENFNTTTGFISRKGEYTNQWVYDTQDQWHELTEAKFTADATARKGNRLDYAGGANSNKFYMQNCGFFSNNTAIDSYHTRTANGTAPDIDFSQLEIPSLPEEPEYLDKSAWSVIDFSSEATSGEGTNGLASLVLDGNQTTYWHSCWSGCDQTYTYPHYLTIDMGTAATADGIQFVQRDGSRKVKDIEVQISNDNTSWQSMGDFVLAETASSQHLDLPQTETFRYLKVIMKSAHDGAGFAAMAEVGAYINN